MLRLRRHLQRSAETGHSGLHPGCDVCVVWKCRWEVLLSLMSITSKILLMGGEGEKKWSHGHRFIRRWSGRLAATGKACCFMWARLTPPGWRMGRGAEASELLVTSICSGADSSMACSRGDWRTLRPPPGRRGLRVQPGLRSQKVVSQWAGWAAQWAKRHHYLRFSFESSCFVSVNRPEKCFWTAHDPPRRADLWFKGKPLLHVF